MVGINGVIVGGGDDDGDDDDGNGAVVFAVEVDNTDDELSTGRPG